MRTNRSKVKDCVTNILSNIIKLSALGVPAVVSLKYDEKVEVYGTQHAKNAILRGKKDIEEVLEKDRVALISSKDPLANEDIDLPAKERAKRFFDDKFGLNDFPKLPSSLERMNAKETIKALRSVIVYDHNTGNGKDDMRKPELYIKYGGSSWEPVFWPNHLWKWDLVKNFSNIKFANLQEMKLNEKYRSLTDFFKDLIRMAFEYNGLDPIDHVGSAPTRVGPKRSKLLEFVTDSAEIPAPRCLLT